MNKLDRPIEPYLDALFDHDEAQGQWYWRDLGSEALQPLTHMQQEEWVVVEVLDRAFSDFDRFLARFTPWQLATGINYVFNNSLSSFAFAVMHPGTPLERRVAMVGRLRVIFDRVFERHCVPSLAHLSKLPDVNGICYMFWEVTPIMNLDFPAITEAAYGVIEHCLASSNVAVVESALHGLGHRVRADAKAARMIDQYIRQADSARPELLAYARAAQVGAVP
jgi:hypothetical protein